MTRKTSKRNFYEPTAGDYIISHLLSCGSTSIQKKVLWSIIQERRGVTRTKYDSSLSRLKRQGILTAKKGVFTLTNIEKAKSRHLFDIINEEPDGEAKIIVMFDIPEKKRRVRDWLRGQLRFWGFTMLQKSVWMGNGKLPKEWNERLLLLGVKKNVRIMRIL